MENVVTVESEKAAKSLTTIIYALYAASFLVGITFFGLMGCIINLAVIMNYLKKDDVAGTFLESHFRWQMRTFWFGLLWGIIGVISVAVFVGNVVLIANAIWMIYRIARGWLCLNDNKPMYAT